MWSCRQQEGAANPPCKLNSLKPASYSRKNCVPRRQRTGVFSHCLVVFTTYSGNSMRGAITVSAAILQAGGTVDASEGWEQVVDTAFVVEHYGHDARARAQN